MDCFNDRRDVSEKGLKRRELFGKLLSMLIDKGVQSEIARNELLKVTRGETSQLLSKMGIKLKNR